MEGPLNFLLELGGGAEQYVSFGFFDEETVS
jgi:hypothetical protein